MCHHHNQSIKWSFQTIPVHLILASLAVFTDIISFFSYENGQHWAEFSGKFERGNKMIFMNNLICHFFISAFSVFISNLNYGCLRCSDQGKHASLNAKCVFLRILNANPSYFTVIIKTKFKFIMIIVHILFDFMFLSHAYFLSCLKWAFDLSTYRFLPFDCMFEFYTIIISSSFYFLFLDPYFASYFSPKPCTYFPLYQHLGQWFILAPAGMRLMNLSISLLKYIFLRIVIL